MCDSLNDVLYSYIISTVLRKAIALGADNIPKVMHYIITVQHMLQLIMNLAGRVRHVGEANVGT